MSILLTLAAAPALIAQAPAVQSQPQALPTVATGVVVDSNTGNPVSGALVQQDGSVTSVFTKSDGTFRLLLDKTGSATLSVSGVGFESVSIQVGNGKDLRVALAPVSGFIPSAPSTAGTAVGASSADTAPLNTNVIFGYRLRHQTIEQGGASVDGFANNDFKLGLRYRMRPWLLEAEGTHHQTPIDVAALPREANPAFSPSTWQAGARVNYLLPLTSDLETAFGVGYWWQNTVPNNNDIRYTGSGVDFEQTRQALGGVGTVAYRPGRGPWHLEGSLGLYPLVLAGAKSPGTPFADKFFTDARASVGYEITPGLRLGIGGQWDLWSGNGSVNSQIISLQAHYTPGGLPKGNE